MKLCDEFKKLPLGLPMTLASVGTMVSLAAGKRWHVGFGAAWAVLSLLHGLQHAGKMKKDVRRLMPEKKIRGIEKLLASMKVAAYAPGRIRIYSEAFVGNDRLGAQAKDYVESFTGVQSATVNPATGSLLIQYDPERLRTKKGLAALEKRICACALHK